MPVAFAYDAELGLLLTTYSGVLDDDLLRRGTEQARGLAARLKPAMGITDATHADITVNAQTAREIASDAAAPGQDIPRAIVAPSDFAFGMARMYQISAAEHRPQFHVVRSMQEAYRLLGVTSAPRFDEVKAA